MIVAIPLLALAAALWCAIPRSDYLAPIVTVLASAIALALSISLLGFADSGKSAIIIAGWLELDAFSIVVLALIGMVFFTASLFSWGYLREETTSARVRLYYANFNLFAFSMLCIPLLSEFGLVWIFVELTTLLSVLLVSYALSNEALEAAWKYMVLTLLGATIAVLGILILFWAMHATGSTDFTWNGLRAAAPSMPHALVAAAFALLLVGYGAKIGLVPLHTWLPDAHSQAPSPVCAMLSGIETGVVLYVLLRLRSVFAADQALHVGTWFAVAGLVSVGVAAFLIVQTHDYKRLFAFSTVEHMGIILTAASIFTPASDVAALWQLLAHAATKSFCFYAAGTVLLVTGSREISAVRGLLGVAPLAAGALLLGSLAIGGAPPFAVFLSELAILQACILDHAFVVTALLALFIVVAFCGLVWHAMGMTTGKPILDFKAQPVPKPCIWALALAAAPVIVLGVWMPESLGHALQNAARVMGS